MRLSVATTARRFSVELSDEAANAWFDTLAGELLVAEPNPPENRKKGTWSPWIGRMLIRCAHCGETRAFETRYGIKRYKCKACGEKTALDGTPIEVHMTCKNGHESHYLTNMDGERISVPCYYCPEVSEVPYCDETGRYEMNDGGHEA